MKQTAIFLLLILVLFSCSENDPGPDNGPTNGNNHSYHTQPVGNSANDLLSSGSYSSLQVEIVHVEGYALTNNTLNNLMTFLENRLHKPQGIAFTVTSVPSPGLAPYSNEDIRTVENDHRTLFNDNGILAVFVFVADGEYSENPNVLGAAYWNTSIILFGSKIDELSGGVGQPSQTLQESTVIQHEFGHIMGLVDLGSPMQTDHKDADHGNHCDVDTCLMYWTAETGDFVANVTGTNEPAVLDSQCVADLQANGGK